MSAGASLAFEVDLDHAWLIGDTAALVRADATVRWFKFPGAGASREFQSFCFLRLKFGPACLSLWYLKKESMLWNISLLFSYVTMTFKLFSSIQYYLITNVANRCLLRSSCFWNTIEQIDWPSHSWWCSSHMVAAGRGDVPSSSHIYCCHCWLVPRDPIRRFWNRGSRPLSGPSSSSSMLKDDPCKLSVLQCQQHFAEYGGLGATVQPAYMMLEHICFFQFSCLRSQDFSPVSHQRCLVEWNGLLYGTIWVSFTLAFSVGWYSAHKWQPQIKLWFVKLPSYFIDFWFIISPSWPHSPLRGEYWNPTQERWVTQLVQSSGLFKALCEHSGADNLLKGITPGAWTSRPSPLQPELPLPPVEVASNFSSH